MVLWLVVNRNPDDFATAFAVEALVGEVVWTAYMCRLDISCDCVYCGLVGRLLVTCTDGVCIPENVQ